MMELWKAVVLEARYQRGRWWHHRKDYLWSANLIRAFDPIFRKMCD